MTGLQERNVLAAAGYAVHRRVRGALYVCRRCGGRWFSPLLVPSPSGMRLLLEHAASHEEVN